MKARRLVPIAVVLVAGAVVFMWPTTQPREETSAASTSTTTPFIDGVYGAAWEVLSGAPVAGRERMALAEVDGRVFVFGGTVAGFSDPDLPPDMFIQDAWIFDPDQGLWDLVPPSPFVMCPLADPVALAGGEAAPVIVWGRTFPGAMESGCVSAATYDPDTGVWTALRGDFFDRLGPGDPVAWQPGEAVRPEDRPIQPTPGWGRIVAPTIGYALAIPGGEETRLQSGGSAGPVVSGDGRLPTAWTGSWLLTVDRGLLFGWEAHSDSWHFDLGGTPIAADGQDMAATDLGAFLVNRRLEAAVLDAPDSMLWSFVESVPLRASACDPEVLSVGGRPLVRNCVGVAIYEAAGGGWIPFSPPIGIDGTMLATADTLYWFSGQVSRLEFAPDGVIAPRRLPIGLTDVELPDGYHFARGIGLVQTTDADGNVLAEVHGFDVSTPTGGTCSLLGSYRAVGGQSEPVGEISVGRPVLPPLRVLDYSQGGPARLVVPTAPTDSVEVRCGNYEEALALVAALQWIEV